MTIALARVDNRLVHGQVLSAWVPALDVDSIVVLDDEASRNTLVRTAMALAIPPDVQFDVCPIAEGAATLEKIGKSHRVLVLLRDVADAERALEAGLPVTRLNLGNVHFAPGRTSVSQAVHLSHAEIDVLESMAGRGVEVELKTLPRDQAVPLSELKHRVDTGTPA